MASDINLKYLITGTGRCGTKFVSQLLTSAGVTCGHESIFSIDIKDQPTLLADSSWLAAPSILSLNKDCKIIHLVRDPIKVISSLMKIRFFALPTAMVGDSRWFQQYEYTKFVYKQFPGITTQHKELDKCVSFYICWNFLIEEMLKTRRYATIRYKIEDVDEDPKKFLTDIGVDPGDKELFNNKKADVVGHHEFKYCEYTLADIKNNTLKKSLLSLAKEYGYNYG